MKHPSTRDLFAYWDKCRGTRSAPDRGEIEPGPIRHLLADTFILSFDPDAGHPFRLAGTRVCALFCRELREEAFLPLWGASMHAPIADLMRAMSDEPVGLVANTTGETGDGLRIEMELLLLPLSLRGVRCSRLLGLLAPTDRPYWLGVKALQNLTLGAFRHVGPHIGGAPRVVAAPKLATEDPSGRQPGLTIYEGGRPWMTPVE